MTVLTRFAKRSSQRLVRAIATKDTFKEAEVLVKSYGLGTLVTNTIILGNSENEEIQEKLIFGRVV